MEITWQYISTLNDEQKLVLFVKAIVSYAENDGIMEDCDFELLQDELVDKNLIQRKTWDEHYEIIKKAQQMQATKSNLSEVEAKSVKPVRSLEETLSFIQDKKSNTLFVSSLKIDGDNIRSNEYDGVSIESITKSRDGSGFDVTSAVNASKQLGKLNTKVLCEATVSLSSLAEINLNYREKPYKTARGCALSILRGVIPYCDKLRLFMFDAVGFEDLKECYDKATQLGYSVVPYVSFKKEDIKTVDDLKKLMNVIEQKGLSLDLMSDGMVIRVSNTDYYEELGGEGSYSNGAIAVKAEQWEKFSNMIGVVKNILIEGIGVNGSARVQIEPVDANGSTINFVSMFNPGYIINNRIRIGDKIIFNYKSNSNPDFVKKI